MCCHEEVMKEYPQIDMTAGGLQELIQIEAAPISIEHSKGPA